MLGLQVDMGAREILQGARWLQGSVMEARFEQLVSFPDVRYGNSLMGIGGFCKCFVFDYTHDVVRFLSIRQWNSPRSLWLLFVMGRL